MNLSIANFSTVSATRNPLFLDDEQIANDVVRFITSQANTLDVPVPLAQLWATRAQQRAHVRASLRRKAPLELVILGFPAKSANRQKTFSDWPDLGEVEALRYLHGLCQEMGRLTPYGARIVICSDGHVFSDLVGVADAQVDAYGEKIREIIANHNFEYLSTFALRDVFGNCSYEEMRRQLLEEHAPSIEALREATLRDPAEVKLFNGIHRFMFEDLIGTHSSLSRNAARQQSKQAAYGVMQRSRAFGDVIENAFPGSLRLSIHPQAIESWKIGLRLVPSRDRWATPWHNVLVKRGETSELMHHSEAKRLGARLRFHEGKYAFFEI